MSLWKKVKCTNGHWHEVYCVGEPTSPYPCTEISRTFIENRKSMIESKKSKNINNAPQEKETMSNSFHNDQRPTVVLVSNKVYELIPSKQWTKENLLLEPPNKRPHVRILNTIPDRSSTEQKVRNKDEEYLHSLYVQIPSDNTILAKTKKNIAKGESIPIEVQKLLDLKDKTKDKKEIRRIRRVLKKLDYKRYIKKGNKDENDIDSND